VNKRQWERRQWCCDTYHNNSIIVIINSINKTNENYPLQYHQAVREEAVREEAVREEAVREEAVREEAVREEAVREEAVREEAVDMIMITTAYKNDDIDNRQCERKQWRALNRCR
jgi:hypothetical protein